MSSTARLGVLVGVDGSEQSKQALRWAVRLASMLGAPIHAVTAWEFPPTAGWDTLMPADWRPDEDSRQILDETLKEVFGDKLPEGLTFESVHGAAARVLIDLSEDAAMLVLGSRGLGGFRELLLGSVSAYCAEHAKCPVLVVREDPPAQ